MADMKNLGGFIQDLASLDKHMKKTDKRLKDIEEVVVDVVSDVKTKPKPKNGNDGKDGKAGKDGKKGERGFSGKDGKDGKDGRDGKDGVSIKGDKGDPGEKGDKGEDGKTIVKEVHVTGGGGQAILKAGDIGRLDVVATPDDDDDVAIVRSGKLKRIKKSNLVAGGAGDVNGPASSTDNGVARYNGTTGKIIQNSGVTIDDSDNIAANNLSGTNTGDQNLFQTIAVAGQDDVVADTTTDTLTLVGGTNVTITTDAGTDTVTIAASGGGGSGDVVGPASATDNALARFDTTTGKLLQNSGVTADDSGNLTANNISGTNTGDQTPATIDIDYIGAATYTTLDDYILTQGSTGIISGLEITDGGSGTVDISAGQVYIRATDSEVGDLKSAPVSAVTGQALTDAVINYIYVEYNAGTPQIAVSTTAPTDYNTNTVVGYVVRIGTTVHISNNGAPTSQVTQKLDRRLTNVSGVTHETGVATSETGTRNIAITAGQFWIGLTPLAFSAFDSSAAGTFKYVYRDGVGGFTEVASQTQINNTQYDDGSGTLATLTTNRYGVHWVYAELDGDVFVLYGQGNYTLNGAVEAVAPASLPPQINKLHAALAAKIIIQKSASTFTSVQNAFITRFSAAQASDHGELSGLADDDHTQYLLVNGTRAMDDGIVLTADSPTYVDGKLFYDSTNRCPAFFNDESDVTLQVGQENWIRVYNNTGSTITNGKVVYTSGKEDVEDRLTIALAQADASNTSKVIGFATHDIETATFGYITQFGYVNDVDTSAFADGEPIWLSDASAGGVVNVEPQSPSFSVFLGYVADSAVSGNLFITTLGNTSGSTIAGDATQVVTPARKGTAGTINKGQPVYITGYNVGQAAVEVELADSDSAGTMPAIGIANDTITNSATGNVVVNGRVANIDTSTYAVNDALYISGTAGVLTTTKPVGSALIQAVARVVRVNASNGVIEVIGAGRANDIPNFTAADKYWYGGTGGVATEGDITTAGRALLDDADASAQRTTLGLGTIATQASTSVNIDGGTIDGTIIGATTPAAATVTDLIADTGQFDAGTGSGVYMPSGVINWDTTAVGNVGTGEDDLITYTLPANTLSVNETGLHIRCMGTGANNANTKTIKLFFGGTTVDTRTLLINNTQDWVFELWIKRTGSSAQTYWYEWSRPAGNSTIVSSRGAGSCTETDTSAIVIKCTGNATSNDDIIQEQQIVKFM